MLPGLSIANWLMKKKKLQCSLVNWLSLRKPVKSMGDFYQPVSGMVIKREAHTKLTLGQSNPSDSKFEYG